jgi:23S rRNA (adenine2503-C2)-methyltransferase
MSLNSDSSKLPIDVFGLSKSELAKAIVEAGEKSFRAGQVWRWIYCEGVYSFAEMTNLSKSIRENFEQQFKVALPEVAQLLNSNDGTAKFLFKLADGKKIETVYIPEAERITICVSSQVGCALKCAFCHTGTQGITRNLTAGEIVQQVVLVRDFAMKKFREEDKNKKINIVFMGMGEPFNNYDNLAQAVKIMMDNEGLAISRRRITISTSGIIPEIKKCAEELRVNLALSLHAPTDEVRNKFMPINKKYPIEPLIEACREYQDLANSRRMTFEYVMLKGVNDSLEDAKQLTKLIRGIPCIVNLIPFNPWPGSTYECSEGPVIDKFAQVIKRAGYQATVRTPRGRDILAACGQLKSEDKRKMP